MSPEPADEPRDPLERARCQLRRTLEEPEPDPRTVDWLLAEVRRLAAPVAYADD